MRASADHIDQIMAVMQTAFDPAYGEAWNRRQLEDALLIGNCHYGLIDAAGAVPALDAGAAGFWLSRHGHREEELLLFAVDPSQRRRGLGAGLLENFIHTATARGAEQLFLEMRQDNPAGGLYRRFGFKPVGRRPRYYRGPDGSNRDAITFVRAG